MPASSDRVPLPGSERTAPGVRQPAASVPADETIEITVVLRRRAEVPESALSRATPLSRDEFARTYGADPADVDLATRTLTAAGAKIVGVDPASRRLRVAGTRRCAVHDLRHLAGGGHRAGTGRHRGHLPATHRKSQPASRSRRCGDRGARAGRPPADPDPVSDSRSGRRHHQLHPAAAGRDLPVPGRHRRHRADGRHPGTGRRLHPGRADHAISGAWASRRPR